VVGKSGPKFKEADASGNKLGPHPGEVMFRALPDTTGFKGIMTMARLGHFLSVRLDRPVEDFTGLKGQYEIDLSWAPDRSIERLPPSEGSFTAASAEARAASADAGAGLPAAPRASIFTAIQESLGLKLEPRKEPVEVLVIDHIERVPTAN